MRVIVLFSEPIQEVDIYRCIWDGAVANEGISPFAYAPLEIQEAASQGAVNARLATQRDSKMGKLIRATRANPGVAETLNRVHYAQVPTVYPPSAKLYFASPTPCARRTPPWKHVCDP